MVAEAREPDLESLRQRVIGCRRCGRLTRFRERVPERSAFRGQTYWRKPVPGYGDPEARLVVVGLAPAAHGGNRTGRVFTGDESGRFLTDALFRAGYSNQPTSESAEDGLVFYDCYLTAAVKCVPPENKPTRREIANCSAFLRSELSLLSKTRCYLALGRLAFDSLLDEAASRTGTRPRTHFGHGVRVLADGFPVIYASFHPSPRNTYTGKLTKRMLVDLLRRIRREALLA